MRQLHDVDETDVSFPALDAAHVIAMTSASSASFSCDNRRASRGSRSRLPKTMRGSEIGKRQSSKADHYESTDDECDTICPPYAVHSDRRLIMSLERIGALGILALVLV